MANTQIDMGTKPDIDNITATAAGTVTNSVRVVIAEGLSKEEAHTTLMAISAAIVGDRTRYLDLIGSPKVVNFSL